MSTNTSSPTEASPNASCRRCAAAACFRHGCREALKFYDSALGSGHVSGDAALRMELLHRQISCYDALHDEAGRMRCVEALMALARKEGDEAMESIALFNLGKSLHYQGDRERGYDYMEQGARKEASGRR